MTIRPWWRTTAASRLVEAFLVAAIVAGSSMIAYRYLAAIHVKHTVEWELEPAVMVACGQGFTRPAVVTPVLMEFLLRGRQSISCAEVAGAELYPPLPVVLGERYAIYSLGFALRAAGLSWRALDAYMAALFGVSMALAYLIFRLIAHPLLAVLGVVGIVWSNQLPALVSFRDYGKQPAFFALWLVLGWLVWLGRRRIGWALCIAAAIAGTLTGIGMGFRVDVAVFVPAFVAVIAFAAMGWDRRALTVKVSALAIFVATLWLTSAPILRSMSAGSNSAHVVLLGLMGSFNRTLGLEPAPYDIGDMYSDTFAYVITSSYADLVEHVGAVPYASAKYDRAGGKLLADLARHFPADALVRGLAATAQAIRSPFDGYARVAYSGMTPFTSPYLAKIGEWRAWVLGLCEGHELELAIFALLLVSWRDWRLGVTGALLILYFCAYSMLQYSRRHAFHLDLIPIVLVLIVSQAVVTLVSDFGARMRSDGRTAEAPSAPRWTLRRALSGTLGIGMLLAMLLVVLGGARWWQQRHVTRLIDRTLAVAWQDVQAVQEPLADTAMRDGVPIVTWTRVFATDPERWQTAVLLRIARPVRAEDGAANEHGASPWWLQVEYFQVQVTDGCSGSVPVAVKYTGVEQTDNFEYTRLFNVPVETGTVPSLLLFPAFYQDGPTWSRFDGIAVPKEDVACVVGVRRARSAGDVPLPLMNAVLPADWRDQPLFQRMLVPPPFNSAGTPTHTSSVARPRILEG